MMVFSPLPVWQRVGSQRTRFALLPRNLRQQPGTRQRDQFSAAGHALGRHAMVMLASAVVGFYQASEIGAYNSCALRNCFKEVIPRVPRGRH